MRLAIFGPGGHGRESIAFAARLPKPKFSELIFVADEPRGPVDGFDVVTPDRLREDDRLVIALGSSEARRRVAERLSHVLAGRLVAATAIVGDTVELGEGALVSDFAMITANCRVGRHFQANMYSYVAHDCVIGDFVTLAPRAGINGSVHVGDGAFIGSGAVIRNGTAAKPLVIGAGAVVGMGAVVTSDVPAGATVVGNPARPLRR
jgi:sugar O-acyltransferase (sialic acid O-acetyltransferase NeuD family)